MLLPHRCALAGRICLDSQQENGIMALAYGTGVKPSDILELRADAVSASITAYCAA